MPRGKSITQISGDLFLSKYDEHPAKHDDDCRCIVIPCIHPGALTHSNDNKVLGRIFAKTLAVAWLTVSIGVEVARENKVTKQQMLSKIMTLVNEKIGPQTTFGKTFKELRSTYAHSMSTTAKSKRLDATWSKYQRAVKAAQKLADSNNEKNLLAVVEQVHEKAYMHAMWKEDTVQLPAFVIRCRKALEELYNVIDCDIAQGDEDSQVRRDQVQRLCGAYSRWLNVDSKPEDQFVEDLSKIEVGEMFYFGVTTIDQQTADLAHLVSFFTKEQLSTVAADWVQARDITQEGLNELQKWIRTEIIPRNLEREEAYGNVSESFFAMIKKQNKDLATIVNKLQRGLPFELEPYETSPHQVLVQPQREKQKGVVHFKWIHDNQQFAIDDLGVPLAASPIVPGEERYLAFVEQGVNIQDADGRSLGVTLGRPVTLPLNQLISQLAGHPLRDEFMALWEREVGLTVLNALEGQSDPEYRQSGTKTTILEHYPESYFNDGKPGRPLPVRGLRGLRLADKMASIREDYLPIQPADAAWLVNRLLEQEYPDEGVIDLGSPYVWPQAQSFWAKLRSFVEHPHYFYHPHRTTIIAACTTVKDYGLANQDKGTYGEAHNNVIGMTRLIQVLRPGAKETKETTKTQPRRFKVVLEVGSKDILPKGALADVPEPKLVHEEETLTVEEVSDEIEDGGEGESGTKRKWEGIPSDDGDTETSSNDAEDSNNGEQEEAMHVD